jgi:hypothetical protein
MASSGEAGSVGVRPIGFRAYADDSPRELDDEAPWPPVAPQEFADAAAQSADRLSDGDDDQGPGVRGWMVIAGVAAVLLAVGAGAGAGLTWSILGKRAHPPAITIQADSTPLPIAAATATAPSELIRLPSAQRVAPPPTTSRHAEAPITHATTHASPPGRRKATASRHHGSPRPMLSGLEEKLTSPPPAREAEKTDETPPY